MSRLVPSSTTRRLPRVVLRTTWVLLGSAIGIAAIGLIVTAAPFLHEVLRIPYAVVLPLLILGIPAIGLLPGIRELEVTAASTLLDLRSELIIPEVLRPDHRWRSAAWVAAHLIISALVVVVLVLLVPTMWFLMLAAGPMPEQTVAPFLELLPNLHDGGVAPVLLLGIPATVLSVGALWLVGVISARLAPFYLGPTHTDRLEVARQRLDLEAEHTRLARELHDGIGHALSIISLQAVAGRRLIARAPERAEESLATIEDTARSAADDLDRMLGLLRRRDAETGGPDDASGRRAPDPGLDRAPTLVETHRRAGLTITADLDEALLAPDTLPTLFSTTAYRILAEALANAQKHAGPGEVAVALRRREQPTPAVEIEVSNIDGGRRVRRRGGRGLRGMTERVALFDGTLDTGPAPDGETWRVHAVLPIPSHHPEER